MPDIPDIDLIYHIHHLDARAVCSAPPLWLFNHDVDRPMQPLL
jgi:hypothetical protein